MGCELPPDGSAAWGRVGRGQGPAPLALLPLLLLLALLAGCGGSGGSGQGGATISFPRRGVRTIPIVPASKVVLPSTAHGCGGAVRLAGGVERLPVAITRWHGEVDILVNVCIDGRGPYPFVVDTGASRSVISAGLAARLGLPAAGAAHRLLGAGCSVVGTPVSVAAWRAAGLALAPQALTSTALRHLSGADVPAGILGSDVWSRFGALRIDFRRSDLVVPGTEAAAPTATVLTRPVTSAPHPPVPAAGPAINVPMFVAETPQGALGVVRVRIGGNAPNEFLVDSGAAISVVGAPVAAADRLTPLPVRSLQMTLCSRVAAPEVSTGPWSVVLDAGAPTIDGKLAPQPVDVTDLFAQLGLKGLLGADLMSRFGSVVIDYAHGRLLLGTG